MSRASHAAAFTAGAIVATAVTALAVPADVARFRALDAFAQSLSLVEQNYVDRVGEGRLLRDATRGMLHDLDVHSTYYPPHRYEKVREDTEGEFGGVGISLAPGQLDRARPRLPPYPIVDEVVPHSPADVAGIQPEDRVVSIDGVATAVTGHAVRDPGAWEAALRGAPGTRVTIAVLRVGWHRPRSLAVVRAQVKEPSVGSRVLAPGVGYLRITRFAEATSADVAAGLARLRTAHALGSLVLDLRDNPGGLVDQAILVADEFLDRGTIVTIRGRRGSVETQVAHPGGAGVGVPIVALVDRGTASAAEILAAALHDHGRAKLVGLPTYGKGTVQTFFDLDDGSGLKLTTARYYTPDGNSLELKGIKPDVRVAAARRGAAVSAVSARGGAGRANSATMTSTGADDPQLAAAVQLARQANRGTDP